MLVIVSWRHLHSTPPGGGKLSRDIKLMKFHKVWPRLIINPCFISKEEHLLSICVPSL